MSETPCGIGSHIMCTADCDCACHEDAFAEPAAFSSGVRWDPGDYKALSVEARANYRKFAYRKFAAKPEGAPRQ